MTFPLVSGSMKSFEEVGLPDKTGLRSLFANRITGISSQLKSSLAGGGQATLVSNGLLLGAGGRRALSLFGSLCERALLTGVLATTGANLQAAVTFTNLYNFADSPSGDYPSSALIQGSDSNFYGTTSSGGTNGGWGTFFEISASGAFSNLYSFSGGTDGGNPSGIIQDSDGNFYGTASYGGGTNDAGTVFEVTANGAFTTLYSFSGGLYSSDGGGDGGQPLGLIEGSNGNFYGLTEYGGTNGGFGTVFEITACHTFISLYSFSGGDGGYPSGLIEGSDGNLYGTTLQGTIFEIDTNGVFNNLYPVGGEPFGIIEGSDGNFYGTTAYGGANQSGSVFESDTSEVLTNLYSFSGYDDGGEPQARLVEGIDGNFYGTTPYGGTNGGFGTVFEISPSGTFTSLYSFGGADDGGDPQTALVQGGDGNLYGSTYDGGKNNGGTLFKISLSGVFTNLYSFAGSIGRNPDGGLAQGSDGNFYGTTPYGGTNNGGWGTVFEISTNGAFTSLYSFTGGNDGATPYAGLVAGTDGNLYGTTEDGGTIGYGTVFKISPSGLFTNLHSFNGGDDGRFPRTELMLGSDGNFFGTTMLGGTNIGYGYGTVFEISPSGAFTNLYDFMNISNGANLTALVQGGDGNFYGTASTGGGTNDAGTVFRIDTNRVLSILHTFTGSPDGGSPSGLVQGSDGNFYGTTAYGGTNIGSGYGDGTVFKLCTNGLLTTLHSFNFDDGAYPCGLLQANDGNFYGITSES